MLNKVKNNNIIKKTNTISNDKWNRFLNNQRFAHLQTLLKLIKDFFYNPKYLMTVLWQGQLLIKLVILCSLIIFCSSLGLIGYGSYLSLTKEVPTAGGNFWEGFVNNEVKNFNPVLESSSNMESRISSLLYAPLYYVKDKDIVPVLLEKPPQWQKTNDNQYRILNFRLRSDISWSDGVGSIDSDDVEYSFDRLKQEGGNQNFHTLFQDVTFKNINSREFQLISAKNNPELIYKSNFRPISKKFYKEQNNLGLISEQRTALATSGYFSLPQTVENPFQTNNSDRNKDIKPNPIRNNKTGQIQTLVLQKSNTKNLPNLFIDQYIIQNFNGIKEIKNNDNTLTDFIKNKKQTLHLFTRNLDNDENNNITSLEINKLLGDTKQALISNNNYYNVFLNIARRNDGYFINRTLRQYILCNIINYSELENSNLSSIPRDKKLILPHLQVSVTNECPNTTQGLEQMLQSARDDNGKQIYSIKTDNERNLKQVLVYGGEIKLNLIAPFKSEDFLLNSFRKLLLDIGLPTYEPVNDKASVQSNLYTDIKGYNILLMTYDLNQFSINQLLGVENMNLLQINRNNREPIPSYQLNTKFDKLEESYPDNIKLQQEIADIFSREYLMANIYRGKTEINFQESNGLALSDKNDLSTFNNNSYFLEERLPKWYFLTKRQ
jgi:hypothetical protein